jgi:hypothetical protein
MALAGVRQWSCILRDPIGQPVPAWYPSNGFTGGREAWTTEKGAGAWDPSYGFRTLLLPETEEGTKEGDDAGGPPASQRGEERLRGVRLAV